MDDLTTDLVDAVVTTYGPVDDDIADYYEAVTGCPVDVTVGQRGDGQWVIEIGRQRTMMSVIEER